MADVERVLRLAGARDPLPGEWRRYRVLDRRNRPATAAPTVVEVVVSAACPHCGRARGGDDESMVVVDHCSGTEHSISLIRNRCPHVEMHEALLEEAERFRLEATG